MKKLFLLTIIFSALILSSCGKKKEITFSFPDNDPLAYLPGSNWALVKDPLVGLRESDSYESKVQNHVRRGDILEVTGKRISTRKNADGQKVVSVWYGFEDGWLEASAVKIYDNKMQAEKAAAKLNK